jgi:hypothetical protein
MQEALSSFAATCVAAFSSLSALSDNEHTTSTAAINHAVIFTGFITIQPRLINWQIKSNKHARYDSPGHGVEYIL